MESHLTSASALEQYGPRPFCSLLFVVGPESVTADAEATEQKGLGEKRK